MPIDGSMYESNSHKSKQQKNDDAPKKIEKVISGTAKTKPKSGLTKLADVFISEDVASVKSYILMDVLIPTIKKALCDIITDGAHMIFYGEAGSRKSNSVGSKVSYRNYYDKATTRDSRPVGARTGSVYNYDDILFDTRGDAEAVLTLLDEQIDSYGIVSVADLFDASGVTPDTVAYKYGWTNIRNAQVMRVRDGFVIKMPRAMPID